MYIFYVSPWQATQISTGRKHNTHASRNSISSLILFPSEAEQAEDALVRSMSMYISVDIMSVSVWYTSPQELALQSMCWLEPSCPHSPSCWHSGFKSPKAHRYTHMYKPALQNTSGRTCGPLDWRAHAGAGLLLKVSTLWKGPKLEHLMKSRVCEKDRCRSFWWSPKGWTPCWSKARVWEVPSMKRKEWQE